MIAWSDTVIPNQSEPFPIDFGSWMEPISGGEATRIDRKGGRWGAGLSFPPLTSDAAAPVVSRLAAAMFGNTLRFKFPLNGVDQGSPGSPKVNGAGQSGKSLAIDGLTPGYQFKEGFWLTIYDQNGRGYLHNCRTTSTVGGGGTATISIEPSLRWPFLDNATIELAAPTIEGLVPVGPWQHQVGKLVQIGLTVREVA